MISLFYATIYLFKTMYKIQFEKDWKTKIKKGRDMVSSLIIM